VICGILYIAPLIGGPFYSKIILKAGGFVGAYAKVIFDKRKKRHEEEH
jgi:hypothetical protein